MKRKRKRQKKDIVTRHRQPAVVKRALGRFVSVHDLHNKQGVCLIACKRVICAHGIIVAELDDGRLYTILYAGWNTSLHDDALRGYIGATADGQGGHNRDGYNIHACSVVGALRDLGHIRGHDADRWLRWYENERTRGIAVREPRSA